MVSMLAILGGTSAEPSICSSLCHSKLKHAVAGGGPASTTRLYLRNTSVIPPIKQRMYNGGATEVSAGRSGLRRYWVGAGTRALVTLGTSVAPPILENSSKWGFTAESGRSKDNLDEEQPLIGGAGRLDNTPKWDVIQTCLITCSASSHVSRQA
jgi:hypothetical protein